jgi:hypothetical protein
MPSAGEPAPELMLDRECMVEAETLAKVEDAVRAWLAL